MLHDLSDPVHSVVRVENGEVTGRAVGQGLRHLVPNLLRMPRTDDGGLSSESPNLLPVYWLRSRGRLIRALSLLIRDDAGEVVGVLCINQDVTNVSAAAGQLQALLALLPPGEASILPEASASADALASEHAAAQLASAVSRNTEAKDLQKDSDIELEGSVLKTVYAMPTLSFKDRGAATLVAHMKAIGVKSCVQDSSGNAGNAVAAYCARAGIQCEIYVPEGTSPKKITMIEAHGAKVHVIPGSRDHCADVCRARVREEGIYYANHVVNPFFYEGMKAYIYEVYEELGRIPEHVVLPVGNGTLFIGAVKALEHLLESGAIDHFPKIVALQSEYCDPLLKARELGLDAPVSIDVKPTIAEGIAIGKPLRGSELLEMMKKHDITVVAAPEDKILAARAKIARAGLYIEHTTAANFAAWDHYCELYGPSTDVLITLCGAGIKSDH